MKKFLSAILVLALALCLWGCSQEFSFPRKTVICGVDVAKLSQEEAWAKLTAAADSYSLSLTAGGTTVTVSGKDIALSCDEAVFQAGITALENEQTPDFQNLITFDEEKLSAILKERFYMVPVNSVIAFDEAQQCYAATAHQNGRRANLEVMTPIAAEAIRCLAAECAAQNAIFTIEARLTQDGPKIQRALAKANALTSADITYRFHIQGEAVSHQISKETLCSFLSLGDDTCAPTILEDKVAEYAEALAQEYSQPASLAPFKPTGNAKVDYTVVYDALNIDAQALADDIMAAMNEGASGRRTVPYLDGAVPGMPYGGNYVEIDLDAQRLWFYKDGSCIIASDLVSGNVRLGHQTPNGIFYLYYRAGNTYLTGPGYRSYVNYWMPFFRGYGMHDANWRNQFGGDIYTYDGSHGCVNLPFKAAQALYRNISSGTKVILYGGKDFSPLMEQEFKGTFEYDVTPDQAPFQLKVWARNGDPELFYSCDNPEVVTVDSQGNVTVVGEGTATITIYSSTDNRYHAGKTTVTITVRQPAETEAEEAA